MSLTQVQSCVGQIEEVKPEGDAEEEGKKDASDEDASGGASFLRDGMRDRLCSWSLWLPCVKRGRRGLTCELVGPFGMSSLFGHS